LSIITEHCWFRLPYQDNNPSDPTGAGWWRHLVSSCTFSTKKKEKNKFISKNIKKYQKINK